MFQTHYRAFSSKAISKQCNCQPRQVARFLPLLSLAEEKKSDPIVVTETAPAPAVTTLWTEKSTRVKYSFESGQEPKFSFISQNESNEHLSDKARKKTPLERLLEPLFPMSWQTSVPSSYPQWAFWRIARHIFRKAYFVLGTTSLLLSLGLGSKQSIAISATLKWVLKDGVAMGTRLLVSTNLARLIDASPKRFFFFGDTLKALSAAVEILSLTNPALFLLCGSVAALLRDAGGAMSGPSYRVFLDAFAQRGNIGDVSSRSEAQEVVGDILGLALGVFAASVLSTVPDSMGRIIPTMSCYAMLVVLHLSCTARAVAMVDLASLNAQRADTILERFLTTGTVPGVAEVNRTERFVRPWKASRAGQKTVVGVSVSNFGNIGEELAQAAKRGDRFTVVYQSEKAGVLIEEGATSDDILTGVLQARKLVTMIDDNKTISNEVLARNMQISYSWACSHAPSFTQALRHRGWAPDRLLFGAGFRYRHEETSARAEVAS